MEASLRQVDVGAGLHPEQPVFLAILATEGNRDEPALHEAAGRLGLRLSGDLDLGLIPDCGPAAFEDALNEQGWRAYVRRVHKMVKSEANA